MSVAEASAHSSVRKPLIVTVSSQDSPFGKSRSVRGSIEESKTRCCSERDYEKLASFRTATEFTRHGLDPSASCTGANSCVSRQRRIARRKHDSPHAARRYDLIRPPKRSSTTISSRSTVSCSFGGLRLIGQRIPRLWPAVWRTVGPVGHRQIGHALSRVSGSVGGGGS